MAAQLPKAILFDLDDTLITTGTAADEMWKAVSETYAPRVEGVTPQALLESVQKSRDWFWSDPERHREGRLNPEASSRQIVLEAFNALGVDGSAVAIEMADIYASKRLEAIMLIEGALETLTHFRGMGLGLALITNGSADGQRSKVDRFDLPKYFDHVLIEGEFGVGKPQDEVYIHVLSQLGLTPQDAWMVGDNYEWEVVAPQRLGMRGIWVDSKGSGLPSAATVEPYRIIQKVIELI